MPVPQHALNWLYSVLTSTYHDVNRTYNDVAQALALYPTLSPRTDVHTFNNGSSALLVHLSGTLPVLFRGATYRFPISVWVPHDYPKAAPLVYVNPTETMVVRPGQHVDPQGQVYHPYLAAWSSFWDKSTISDLLTILTDVFAKEPPVIARPPQTQQTPQRPPPANPQSPQPAPTPPQTFDHATTQQPYPTGAAPSHGPPRPPKPGAQPNPDPSPPPPPKPEALPRLPQMPVSSHTTGSSRGSDQPPRPPPRPGSIPSHGMHMPPTASPEPTNQSRSSRYDSAPPLPHLAARPPQHTAPPAHFTQPLATGPPPQNPPTWQSPPLSQHPAHSFAAQHQYGGPPAGVHPQHPPPPHQMYGAPPQLPPQKKQPPPDLLDEPSEMKVQEQGNAPPPPIPPNPERDALLRQLGKALHQEREQSLQKNDAYIAGLQGQHAAMVNAYNALSSERLALGQVSALLNSNAGILREALRKADAVIENSRQHPEPDIDELLVAPTVVANQLYTLVAEERAIGDAIFMLGRAVERGRISPAVFAKTTRSLAREWYLKKALIRKVATGMGLSV